MDTSWWLALAAVVLLALVATLVDGWGRGRRPGGRRLRPPGRPGGRRAPGARPSPGDIWWAEVPYEEDRTGVKDRPCLVLTVHGDRATVAKITTKYHDERAGVIPLPPGAVGDAHGRPSFLETDELREVPVGDFRRRVGVVDPVLWDQVRHLAG
ncbi:type II toxin-antitoxin system PemK/MazF family toxin [Streptomyces sp. NPDC002676]